MAIQKNTPTATREGDRKGLSRVTGQSVKKTTEASVNKAVTGQVASVQGDLSESRSLQKGKPKEVVMSGTAEKSNHGRHIG